MNYFNFSQVSSKNFSPLFVLIFLSFFFSDQTNAQCCSSNLVENGDFETAISVSENFPFGTGTNNAETGELYEWYYDDGTNSSFAPTFVIDATKASEGDQFMYIPFGGTVPSYNRCIGNSLSYTTDLSDCTVDTYTDGLRYVSHYDWVPFNKDVTGGGTGSTRPTFEFQSPFTVLDVYDESGTIVNTNSTAVAWNDIAKSWERVYSVTPEITDLDGIGLWYSHINTATCGILVDDAYFAPLVIYSSVASNIQEGGASDEVTFELNPSTNLGPVPAVNYSVSAPSGYSISPTSGTYGGTTTFTLTINSGTMKDDGDLTMGVSVFDEINTTCSVIATVSNPFDVDKDGIVNDLDIDTDGDGIEDTAEYLNLDPLGDEDGDGTLNFEDVEDNGLGDGSDTDYEDSNIDGVPDAFDADLDGIVNHFDLDADNDGIPDLLEAGGVDADGNGISDDVTDTDGDGLVDKYDPSCIGSTLGNAVAQINTGVNNPDNALGVPGSTRAKLGNGDVIELDLGMTVPSGTTIELYLARTGTNNNTTQQQIRQSTTSGGSFSNAQIYTSTQNTSSGPEIFNYILVGDARYIEIRRVTKAAALYGVVFSFTETCTDGIAMPNSDTDNDGLPNSIDLDADNDGIPDLVEAGGIDTDGDGLADVTTDADLDGFVDVYDPDDDGVAGVDDATDPLLMTGGTDTDSDGFANDDAITFIDGSSNNYDTDGDGYIDGLDLDADNDGIPDIIEAGGSTPLNDGMVDVLAAPWDSDNDGLADVYDENNWGTALVETTADTNSDGQVNSTETMSPGNTNIINADSDPYPNHLDLDADNDGITDVIENAGGAVSVDHSSGTLDGIVGDNATVTDTDNNGWHDSSNTSTTDSDSDGLPDYLDIDADNDGIVDYLEGVCSTCPTFLLDPTGNPTDTNENGVLDIYESLNSSNGAGGSNIGASPNVDDDSANSTPDYLDTDSDSDGANDWTEGYDANDNGQASDDLITIATNYENATSNGYYVNANDDDFDGIPNWLDNQSTVSGYDEATRPPFLDPTSSFWFDDDNDGLVDLLDSSQNGTDAPTPDNNGGNDLDWRDKTALISLPVELSSFFANEEDCIVVLKWTTESEEDFDYFEIQWSGDGYEFKSLERIKGAGGSTGQVYSFQDKRASELNYYRLKMVDLDGAIEYSKIISIDTNCGFENEGLNFYPNPISSNQGFLNVEFVTEKMETQLLIVDVLGRTVKRISFEAIQGMTNYIQIDISDLPAGTYSLQQVGTRKPKLFIIQE